jgi:hypothetical protein
MYSRDSDVSLKNGMWRKIWMSDIDGILMMLKRYYPKKMEQKKNFQVEPLTSRFSISNLDQDFFA